MLFLQLYLIYLIFAYPNTDKNTVLDKIKQKYRTLTTYKEKGSHKNVMSLYEKNMGIKNRGDYTLTFDRKNNRYLLENCMISESIGSHKWSEEEPTCSKNLYKDKKTEQLKDGVIEELSQTYTFYENHKTTPTFNLFLFATGATDNFLNTNDSTQVEEVEIDAQMYYKITSIRNFVPMPEKIWKESQEISKKNMHNTFDKLKKEDDSKKEVIDAIKETFLNTLEDAKPPKKYKNGKIKETFFFHKKTYLLKKIVFEQYLDDSKYIRTFDIEAEIDIALPENTFELKK